MTIATLTSPSASTPADFLVVVHTSTRNEGRCLNRKSGRADIIPRENTNDPTPKSICNRQTAVVSSRAQRHTAETFALTTEVPHVSALANSLGNTSKSTAKIQITVMTIMWALYTVTHPFGLSLRSPSWFRFLVASSRPTWGLRGGSECGGGKRVAAYEAASMRVLRMKG